MYVYIDGVRHGHRFCQQHLSTIFSSSWDLQITESSIETWRATESYGTYRLWHPSEHMLYIIILHQLLRAIPVWSRIFESCLLLSTNLLFTIENRESYLRGKRNTFSLQEPKPEAASAGATTDRLLQQLSRLKSPTILVAYLFVIYEQGLWTEEQDDVMIISSALYFLSWTSWIVCLKIPYAWSPVHKL